MSYCLLEVHTDAFALKYLTMMKNQSRLFTRWYQELAGFNFTVVHKKGKENINTDALSCDWLSAYALLFFFPFLCTAVKLKLPHLKRKSMQNYMRWMNQ